MAEIPQYTIRESVRAKHVILKMSLSDGLVIVVPKGFDLRHVPQIIDEKKGWIERGLKRIEQRRNALDTELAPRLLSLRAISEDWRIEYKQSSSSRITATIPEEGCIVLSGNTVDHAMIKSTLQSFLLAKARMDFPDLLLALADKHGFAMTRISVRLQKTRWGSCSQKGAISLNAKLLFLPRHLVDYVLIHELCHTVHHNHSPAFWKLVQKHLPQAQALRRALRCDAWRFVPLWFVEDGQRSGRQE